MARRKQVDSDPIVPRNDSYWNELRIRNIKGEHLDVLDYISGRLGLTTSQLMKSKIPGIIAQYPEYMNEYQKTKK